MVPIFELRLPVLHGCQKSQRAIEVGSSVCKGAKPLPDRKAPGLLYCMSVHLFRRHNKLCRMKPLILENKDIRSCLSRGWRYCSHSVTEWLTLFTFALYFSSFFFLIRVAAALTKNIYIYIYIATCLPPQAYKKAIS